MGAEIAEAGMGAVVVVALVVVEAVVVGLVVANVAGEK